LAEGCALSKLKEFFEWGEHVRLVFDVVAAIASLKVVKKSLSYIPQISHDWASIISWLMASAILFGLVTLHQKHSQRRMARPSQINQSGQSSDTNLIPATSTIVSGVPGPSFDAKEFFRIAYYSSVTAETEKNFRVIAEQNEPNDPGRFLLKFIGVGLVAYLHDYTWFTIFKSQILMLLEMNARNGHMSLADAKNYYDQAAVEYPQVYPNYTFEQWMAYLRQQQLILQYPSNMLEITVKGKDFLKYLTHWGRYPDGRKC
jgi:hypothetical protein